MKAKIFKTILYTLLIVAGMQSIAMAQEQTQKEKDLEAKLKALELKMDAMQSKMDSLKTSQKRISVLKSGSTITYPAAPTPATEPRKIIIQRTPAPKSYSSGSSSQGTFSLGSGFDKAFSSFDKITIDSHDQKLEEKIKSGEIKEVTKTYTKSYNIDKDDVLSIDNKYGKVVVNTWNKNEFKVEVQIKADANEQDEAQKILDGVSINDSKDGSDVSFKTTFKDNNSSWSIFSSNGKYTIHKVEINYTVYMPSKNPLTITNRYGGTVIPNFDGKLSINSSYGSFTAKNLTNPSSEISSRYGSAAIESLKGSALKVAYGSLNLGACDNINAELSYSAAKIASIKTSGTINMRYGGGLKIAELDKNLKALSVNSTYSSVQVGLNNDQNFNFDVSVHYGSFVYGDHGITVTDKTPADDERGYSSTKTYKGHLGKGNADKVISIKTSYGSVKFD
ncbi:DUF4097 domain-containing protein [Mucilaginibacter sp. HMF5004]|uniref:DUF4097 domain-containing protein n=1 Tax=Mucilaginibacter rivuli TaxID=2857527 RepID=UPI001C5EAE59|nr:DUF4097 domain-containing protein [Mucilaginibacter rivuli]MBW4888639.1 DUF4097 domain-containing protein [Mucilaginibacter rivuli]